jgi:hypothetical protein
MSEHPAPMFRQAAMERYLRGQEEAVSLQLMRPRTFLVLWGLLGVLLMALLVLAVHLSFLCP